MHPSAADASVLRRMLAPIAHRGPDECDIHIDERVAFGHLRLAIVDLDGGHQPRVDPTTGDALVFNGEIYGFATLAAELANAGTNLVDRSDTEVLFRMLQRYGVRATLERIDGMFAFAFYEASSGRLHLARDRFGEKPLYFLERGGVLVFGSEPQAVLAHPLGKDAAVDLGAVATFLAFEYMQAPWLRHGLASCRQAICSPISRVASIRNATGARIGRGAARARRGIRGRTARPAGAMLDETVRERLVADVPVALSLRRVDSSLVAAFVARHAPGLTAITVAIRRRATTRRRPPGRWPAHWASRRRSSRSMTD